MTLEGNLDNCPTEIIAIIMGFMDHLTVITFASTSKRMRKIFSEHSPCVLELSHNVYKTHMPSIVNFYFDYKPNLESLTLTSFTICDSSFFDRLATMTNLKNLALKESTIDFNEQENDDFQYISSLEKLDLSDHGGMLFQYLMKRINCVYRVHIETKGSSILCSLRHLTMLKELNIEPVYSNEFLTEEVASFLTSFQDLTNLRIGGLDDNTVKSICGLTNLRKLEIVDSAYMSMEGFAHISNLVGLETLNITFGSNNNSNPNLFKTLSSLKNLRHVTVKTSGIDCRKLEAKLKTLANLETYEINLLT